MPVLIKNCGLRTRDAIATAADTGADFIGFVHYPSSPRHLSLEDGAALQGSVPARIQRVAVLVSPTDVQLDMLVKAWLPDMLQLHGITDPLRMQEIKQRYALPLIIGVAVDTTEDIIATHRYSGIAEYLLFDTRKEGAHGGTGERFDWSLLQRVPPALPWFLAGGLSPGNVADAIAHLHPPAVDVSSGIESAPGIKSLEKIAAFNRAVLDGAHEHRTKE